MTPERVRLTSPLVLKERQRDRYFADGFLCVPGYLGAGWLARLRAVVAERSRSCERSPFRTTSSTWHRTIRQTS